MKDESAALKAVEFYQASRGVEQEVVKNSPLHYNMADLVLGLMKLSAKKGLEWSAIVRDAKEGFNAR